MVNLKAKQKKKTLDCRASPGKAGARGDLSLKVYRRATFLLSDLITVSEESDHE